VAKNLNGEKVRIFSYLISISINLLAVLPLSGITTYSSLSVYVNKIRKPHCREYLEKDKSTRKEGKNIYKPFFKNEEVLK
jgi:hypothetical protein